MESFESPGENIEQISTRISDILDSRFGHLPDRYFSDVTRAGELPMSIIPIDRILRDDGIDMGGIEVKSSTRLIDGSIAGVTFRFFKRGEKQPFLEKTYYDDSENNYDDNLDLNDADGKKE